MNIINVALATPLRQHFDYLIPATVQRENLQIGARVLVPFGRQEKVGIVIGFADSSEMPLNKLKPMLALLDEQPLFDDNVMALCRWASRYYQHPLGEVLHAALPAPARKAEPVNFHSLDYVYPLNSPEIKLSPRQQACVDQVQLRPGLSTFDLKQLGYSASTLAALISKQQLELRSEPPAIAKDQPLIIEIGPELNCAQTEAVKSMQDHTHFHCFLLNGVTGSGKTEVYLRAIETQLQRGKQALVLIPEIGLTPQTVQRFMQRFAVPVVAWHSRLSDSERLQAWIAAKTGVAKIIIGTRSAILTPAPQLGIIILDEEHDLSFKQQSRFRYSARDLAVKRAKLLDIPVLMGSATPSLESLYNVNQQRFTELRLPERAGGACHPQYQVIDLRRASWQGGLSEALIAAIRQHLANNNQVLLFLNRRGFSPLLLCHDCGWTAQCPHCDVKLTYHQSINKLCCHHCGAQRPRYAKCLDCQSTQLINLGLGTEQLESILAQHFTDTQIVRIDQDTTRGKTTLHHLLDKVREGERQILIGTQMLAKGHHFPNVTLVGLIDVDSALFSSDFRAVERLGQLITQVAGRAGRANKPGTVILQTHQPDHPLLQLLLSKGYAQFAQNLLIERQTVNLPPYSFLAILHGEGKSLREVNDFLEEVKKTGSTLPAHHPVQLIGPLPSPLGRKQGRYRGQLIIQANKRQELQRWLAELLLKIVDNKRVRWAIDVDPLELS